MKKFILAKKSYQQIAKKWWLKVPFLAGICFVALVLGGVLVAWVYLSVVEPNCRIESEGYYCEEIDNPLGIIFVGGYPFAALAVYIILRMHKYKNALLNTLISSCLLFVPFGLAALFAISIFGGVERCQTSDIFTSCRYMGGVFLGGPLAIFIMGAFSYLAALAITAVNKLLNLRIKISPKQSK
jgi:hypothetical protein